MLCLKGCIVTLDAMGCQKAIARQIRKQEADYVLRVQANHKGLHRRLEDTFALERATGFAAYAHDYADTVGKDHGRIEIRRCWTIGDPALLAHPDHEWCDLASLVWVESERRIGDRVTTDVCIFISSLPPKARSRCRNAVLGALQSLGWHTPRPYLRDWLRDGTDRAAPCRVQLNVQACCAPLLRWVLAWWQGPELNAGRRPDLQGMPSGLGPMRILNFGEQGHQGHGNGSGHGRDSGTG